MKALVYRGPGDRALEETSSSALNEPMGAVVEPLRETACDVHFHILKDPAPAISGREGSVVEEVTNAVPKIEKSDRVSASCGKCVNCKKGVHSHSLVADSPPHDAIARHMDDADA